MSRYSLNTDAKESYQSISFPLILPYNGFGTSAVPIYGPLSYMKNAVIAKYLNPTSSKMDLEVRPRGGLDTASTYVGTTANLLSRGIFYWDKTDRVYTVFADSLDYVQPFFSPQINLTGVFTSGGTYNYGHFTEYFDGTTYYLTTKKTSPTSKAYIIDTANVLTEIVDADYPNTTAIGAFVSVDGYLFVMTNTGRIYNSDLGAPLSWTSTSFLTASISPDKGRGLAKYKNQVVAFGTNSVEFFYNAANPTGSPLARTEQAAITGIGCIDAKTIVEMQDTIYWVSGGSATNGVYKLENFKPKKISNDAIDQTIAHLELSNENFYAGKILIMGQERYFFSIADYTSSGIPTLIYFEELDLWIPWTTRATNGNTYQFGGGDSVFPTANYTANGMTFLPSTGTGTNRIILYFQDSGVNGISIDFLGSGNGGSTITYELKTRPTDFGTHNFIRIHKIIFKVLARGATVAVNYPIRNLGRWQHPSFSITQTTVDTGDLQIAINGGTARTIASILDHPVIIDAEIQYSICEH